VAAMAKKISARAAKKMKASESGIKEIINKMAASSLYEATSAKYQRNGGVSAK